MRIRVGLLPVGLLFLAACHEDKPYTKPLTTVKVQAVDTYRAEGGQQYSGNIEPRTRNDVGFRLGGYVEEILTVPMEGGSARRLVQEGDPVAKGAILVKLRQNDYTVKVDQAQSQLEQAAFAVTQAEEAVKAYRAGLAKAKLDHERATNLFRTGSLIKPDLDGAQAQLDAAQAQLDGAEAQVKLGKARHAGARSLLEEAQIAVRDSSIKSPIDGVVLKRVIEIGQLVGPGTPAYVLGDVRQVRSVFGVPDTVLPRLKLGMSLRVTSEGLPGAAYMGRITRIAPTADPRSRVFEIELTVENKEGRLKPGMIAAMTLPGGSTAEPVPVVPLNAVVQPPPGGKGYMVFVLEEQGGKATVKARPVELGEALGERIAVKSGLRGGERVVVTGASLVHDGETVEVVPLVGAEVISGGTVSTSNDAEDIRKEKNTARFCVENRQITWVLLIATVLWGVYGYINMSKRKDPEFPTLITAVVVPWPGVPADKVEQQLTRKIEQRVSENLRVKRTESISQGNLSIVYVTLEDDEKNPAKQWDDIDLKLKSMTDLPDGAGPITYLKDFGDTAALMLTVASPKASPSEISWRASEVRKAIDTARATKPAAVRTAGVLCFPTTISPAIPQRGRDTLLRYAQDKRFGKNIVAFGGPGFVGIDGDFGEDEKALTDFVAEFFRSKLRPSELHLDVWPPVFIRDIKDVEARLGASPGERYSLRQLDEFTALIQRTLQGVGPVNKVQRAGVVPERIYLEYSQQRLAGYGIQPASLQKILQARNTTQPGGLLEEGGKNTLIDPSGSFKSPKEIGGVVVAATDTGLPIYLRDGVDIYRGYASPPLYLNYYNWRNEKGEWQRTRGITLAVQMRSGQQIANFGKQVDESINGLKKQLPEDLILARTSDQPLQVQENVDLFMKSLYEAIILVVVVALIGFWEWRSALLMAISIPLTLAMTFGMMHLLGIDVQQVSIASLIIALGLLVDDPVVAGDAIKRELDMGQTRTVAAWLGPTKLATAILFATVTNIVAYLPLLLISSNTGAFIHSLPIVLGCSLVASRIASMTFVPMLGYYLLRAPKKQVEPMATRRTHGFAGVYYKIGTALINHRKMAFLCSLVVLGAGYYFIANMRLVFFPKDLSYLFFADVWLPEDANIGQTDAAARTSERVIHGVAEQFGKTHPEKDGKPREILASLTTFVGGGGPRFWFSVAPELLQPNYAQILIQVKDKEDTEHLIEPLQLALAKVPGARVDVRQLETSQPIGVPVQIRLTGESETLLRSYAERVKKIFRDIPASERIRDNWGASSLTVKLQVDSDRANLAGISNLDVAVSSAGGMSGLPLTTLRNGDEEIPVLSRLRIGDRSTLSDIEDLYVYSLNGPQRVPLRQISSISYQMGLEKIRRRNQFRTITVGCYPSPGVYPSELMNMARPELTKLNASLPVGYSMQIGGEEEERIKGFREVTTVLIVSVVLIFMALVIQFRSAFKPIIVFAAIPYGVVGALAGLALMNSPFGFIAFLGITSLIGVIVSHVIVLFDFIEEAREEGQPLKEALLDAGILRLRPVLITVGATVFALIPLAMHGGPLWEPLCYAQIGGLTFATFITLLLVPVIYAIFVMDLKLVKWERETETES